MNRLIRLLKTFAQGGPRCPWCGVPSPHRFPHRIWCPWVDYSIGLVPSDETIRVAEEMRKARVQG